MILKCGLKEFCGRAQQGKMCGCCVPVSGPLRRITQSNTPPAAGPWIHPVEGDEATQPPKDVEGVLGKCGNKIAKVMWGKIGFGNESYAWLYSGDSPRRAFAMYLDCFARLDLTGAEAPHE